LFFLSLSLAACVGGVWRLDIEVWSLGARRDFCRRQRRIV